MTAARRSPPPPPTPCGTHDPYSLPPVGGRTWKDTWQGSQGSRGSPSIYIRPVKAPGGCGCPPPALAPPPLQTDVTLPLPLSRSIAPSAAVLRRMSSLVDDPLAKRPPATAGVAPPTRAHPPRGRTPTAPASRSPPGVAAVIVTSGCACAGSAGTRTSCAVAAQWAGASPGRPPSNPTRRHSPCRSFAFFDPSFFPSGFSVALYGSPPLLCIPSFPHKWLSHEACDGVPPVCLRSVSPPSPHPFP